MSITETAATDETRTILVDGAPSPEAEAPVVERGRSLGRYLVVEELGAGGMGVVYRAYDPKLRREVALKVLRLIVRQGSREEAEARLLREAQAMAQLSHPNVLPVFDVDVVDTTDSSGAPRPLVFIAMEYVVGATLKQWSRETERSWREVLSVMIPAGRGLAAAHAAGMVHRDFKPANVLVGRDDEAHAGRVRVMDFGLARLVEDAPESVRRQTAVEDISDALRSSVDDVSTGSLDQNLTQVGVVVGTPAYMSPEHHRGQSLDARSDVYSFCIALYEALCGERPFRTKSPEALAGEKLRGTPTFPTGRHVPGWLERACLRGLAPKPEDRWASMDELLAVLERDPDRARRRMVMTVGAVGLVGLGGLAAWSLRTNVEGPCAQAGAGVDDAWGPERRGAVAKALLSLEIPYLTEVAPRVDATLEAYASTWIDARIAACKATHVQRVQSPEMLDRAMMCLDHRREVLRATVDALAGSTKEEIARKAVRGAFELPSLEPCADEAYLRTTVPPPVDRELARTVAEIRSGLADVRALGRTGQVGEGLAMARELAARARPLDYPPIRVETRRHLGNLLHDAGKFEEARDELVATYFGALATGHDQEAAASANMLVFATGKSLSQAEPARVWAQHTEALLDRLDDDGEGRARLVLNLGSVALESAELDVATLHYQHALELHAELYGENDPRYALVHSNLGIVFDRQRDLDAAIAHYQRAIDVFETSLGKDHPDVAMPHVNIGSALNSKGDFDAAHVHLERALSIWEQSLGPDHPHVATVLNNIGTAFQDQGRDKSGLPYHERALDIRVRVLGETHPDVAMSLNNIGNIRRNQGDLEGSQRDHLRALEIRRTALGEDHPLAATSAYNLGVTYVAQERLEEGRAQIGRAIETFRTRLDPNHPYVATGLGALADIDRKQGNLTQAIARYEQALEVFERRLGPDHFHVAEALLSLGRIELEADAASDARQHLQRARSIVQDAKTQPQLFGGISFALAQAAAARGERATAITRAQEALAAFEAVEDAEDTRAEVEAWLAKRH